VVVTLPAEIDIANAGQIGEQLGSALAGGVSAVAADMTATTFCDSSGIRVLVLAHQQAAANNAELRVVIPSARVRRALAITNVDTVLLIYPSLDAALAPHSGPAPPGDDTGQAARQPGTIADAS
jgi:anti-sigma B factor antagonist